MRASVLLLSSKPDREDIAKKMRGFGVEVFEVSDCESAFRLAFGDDWTAVIVETQLAEQHLGWEFIAALQNRSSNCPEFILLCDTPIDMEPQAELQERYGVTGFLERPLNDPRKLRSLLRTYKII